MLTPEFIAGYISALGSFLEYQRNGRTYFAFQIKTSISNRSVLNMIAAALELNNRVYTYTKHPQSYALLIVRDRHSILNKIIPALEGRLVGEKEISFNEWKQEIIKNCSTWNYRNIKAKGNPEKYIIVDNNPNTLTKRGG